MPEYRSGALYVVESAKAPHDILKELRLLDDRLFLEKQISMDNMPVWCVVVDVGGDVPPITIVEWRDDNDVPLELSSGIVGRITRMERDGARLTEKVVRQNRELIASHRRDARDAWSDIGADFQARMNPMRSAVLHRGQYLRRSRDKRRSRGEIL